MAYLFYTKKPLCIKQIYADKQNCKNEMKEENRREKEQNKEKLRD